MDGTSPPITHPPKKMCQPSITHTVANIPQSIPIHTHAKVDETQEFSSCLQLPLPLCIYICVCDTGLCSFLLCVCVVALLPFDYLVTWMSGMSCTSTTNKGSTKYRYNWAVETHVLPKTRQHKKKQNIFYNWLTDWQTDATVAADPVGTAKNSTACIAKQLVLEEFTHVWGSTFFEYMYGYVFGGLSIHSSWLWLVERVIWASIWHHLYKEFRSAFVLNMSKCLCRLGKRTKMWIFVLTRFDYFEMN